MAEKSSGQDSGNAGSNAMWGARFDRGPVEAMEGINSSLHFDRRLAAQDVRASRAHCRMLGKTGIISSEASSRILEGLDLIEKELADGSFPFDAKLEDIHMNVEARLAALIGEDAGRLHTARSRNDQVATDFRLWVRDNIDALDDGLKAFQGALIAQAETHADTIMPGFTHMQGAQPVTFGHHLMAYYEMARRDRSRLADCRERLNECPLGAGALAGTPFPIDRAATADALEFREPARNSMDAVSDRDFALEFLSALSIAAVHLSRLAEEIVLWSGPQFAFVRLSDSFSTGSSIMPQKRNPDGAELVRAKAGRIIGSLTGLLVVMKGLPLAYSKDMQEDKEPVFDAAGTFESCIAVMTGMIADLEVDKARMAEAANAGFLTATDLADWLVRSLELPFRKAHHITGSIVKLAEEKNCGLAELALAEMQKIEPGINADVFSVLAADKSVASRSGLGGTAPGAVRAAIAIARKELARKELE
ncbi:MAG: argininosuccinate lyase [Proteobacteria bacterium]|nr:argininosuccinate lyase [Pseudomonadota bacterium]